MLLQLLFYVIAAVVGLPTMQPERGGAVDDVGDMDIVVAREMDRKMVSLLGNTLSKDDMNHTSKTSKELIRRLLGVLRSQNRENKLTNEKNVQ